MIVSEAPATTVLKPLCCAEVIETDEPLTNVNLVAVNASPALPPDFTALAMLPLLPILIISLASVANVPVTDRPATLIVLFPPVPVVTFWPAAVNVMTLPPPARTYVSTAAAAVTVPDDVNVICSAPEAVTVLLKLLCCAAVIVTEAPLASVSLVASKAVPVPVPSPFRFTKVTPSPIEIVSPATVLKVPVGFNVPTAITSSPFPPVVTF